MAYDKVVDSAVLNAGLKQIADAIREKGGTSDNLAFPQAMANAIAAIEAGGDGGFTLPTNVKAVAVDTFVLARNAQTLQVSHSLGERPSYALLLPSDLFYGASQASGYHTKTLWGLSTGINSGSWGLFIPFDGSATYNSSAIGSIGKKNTERSLTEYEVWFSGSNSGYYIAGEYLLVTVKLNIESREEG